MKNTINELLIRYQSDKATHHSYGPLYEELFFPYKEMATDILELGVENGCSIRAFREYFSNANIFGIEKEEHKLFSDEKIKIFHCDTTNRDGFILLAKELPMFDIIIDDASHVFVEQIFAVSVLWNNLKPGGLFIIEDLYREEYLDLFNCFINITKYNFDKCGSDRVVVIRKN